MMPPILLAALALVSLSDPARELAKAIDLPTPAEREARAQELALLPDVSLEQWLAAMRAFGEFGMPRGDRGFVRAPLQVLDKLEPTNLHLLVPENFDPQVPHPLIVALHAAGDGGEQAIVEWQETARALGALVLAPTERGGEAGYGFSERERALALAALRWMRRSFDVDEERILLSGIGCGADLAWDLALRHPGRFAALVPLLGRPRMTRLSGQDNLRLLENVAPLALRDLQGAQDDPLLLGDLRLAFERLAKLEARDARLVEFPELGANYRLDAVDWKAFFGGARRTALPPRVVICATRLSEARHAWVEITAFEKDVEEDFSARIPAASWVGLDPAQLRTRLLREAEKRTARLEVEYLGEGRFRAQGQGVAAFRLLLVPERTGPGGVVQVQWRGKPTVRVATSDKRVLLSEFVERFDRGFLPLARCDVP